MREHSGNKYHREIKLLPIFEPTEVPKVDVYCVLDAFEVTCPARQHAIKKILCAGLRGKGSEKQDLEESIDALRRAIELL